MSGKEQVTKKLLLLFIATLLLFSCQTTPEVTKKREPKIALVLGGGSAKGFAHVGVIRVFEQEKIPILVVSGYAGRHHDLGALGRTETRWYFPGCGDEQFQPLCIWCRRRMDVCDNRRHRPGSGCARLQTQPHPSTPRRRDYRRPRQPYHTLWEIGD